MSFVVDTDVCSAYMRGNPKAFNKFMQHGGGLFVTTVTLAELWTWVDRSKDPDQRKESLLELLRDVEIIPFDAILAKFTGQLRATLMSAGISIPTPDLLNGATALFRNFTLVTHNVKDFTLIPNLRIEDWLD